MPFKRKGSPEPLKSTAILEYDKEKEVAVICSNCHDVLGYVEVDKGLVRIGSTVTLGTTQMICGKCKENNSVTQRS